ncbi:ROK family protein [Herbiconiux sp. P16]|uniref:ROK family protein n=1 Tax=Herbiconiux wuyangfengii TaxID=3342794 RepID=UPI0035B81101
MIGIDVGGTTIKGIRVSADGRVECERRCPTPSPDPTGERVVDAVAGLVDELGGVTDAPIGLVVPGIVDEVDGIAVRSMNVGLRDAPVRALAEARLGTAVAFGQDVRAGALAELRSGAARGVSGSLAFVPIGTGVAAAFVVDGHPLVSGGWAGEIGQNVLPSGPFAGLRMEEVASASATARRAGEPDARAVAARVAAGDADALAVWNDTVAVLADALTAIVVTIAPEMIVVGGGLAQAGALLLDPLGVALTERIGGLRAPRLVAARHGDIAAALGAAYLAADLAEATTAPAAAAAAAGTASSRSAR